MKTTVAMLSVLVATPAAWSAELPTCMLGRWKSHEEKTLESMRSTPGVSDKARALFEKNFFGRLIVINTPRRSGGYLLGEQTREQMNFELHEITEAGSTHAVFIHRGPYGETSTQWFCEGEFIYALTSRWQFREYFARLP